MVNIALTSARGFLFFFFISFFLDSHAQQDLYNAMMMVDDDKDKIRAQWIPVVWMLMGCEGWYGANRLQPLAAQVGSPKGKKKDQNQDERTSSSAI